MRVHDNVSARKLLGTIPSGPVGLTAPTVSSVPSSFDSRTKWGTCVHPIRNQEKCGSCWAFGSSEALSDRFCIASNGSVDVVLSPQELVSCDKSDMGCNGGWLNKAWSFLEQKGLPTDSAYPYNSGGGASGTCKSVSSTFYKCQSGSVVEATTPEQIKSEIYKNGPMETAFTVYQDFMSYKSGVYHHTTGSMLGGHAIKVLGWGNEDGMDYWLCANSWGPSWGLDGFFKIKQGDCGIDQAVYACTPEVKGQALTQ